MNFEPKCCQSKTGDCQRLHLHRAIGIAVLLIVLPRSLIGESGIGLGDLTQKLENKGCVKTSWDLLEEHGCQGVVLILTTQSYSILFSTYSSLATIEVLVGMMLQRLAVVRLRATELQ